eukprot:4696745-Pleurochrysis_carterae.AAC.3
MCQIENQFACAETKDYTQDCDLQIKSFRRLFESVASRRRKTSCVASREKQLIYAEPALVSRRHSSSIPRVETDLTTVAAVATIAYGAAAASAASAAASAAAAVAAAAACCSSLCSSRAAALFIVAPSAWGDREKVRDRHSDGVPTQDEVSKELIDPPHVRRVAEPLQQQRQHMVREEEGGRALRAVGSVGTRLAELALTPGAGGDGSVACGRPCTDRRISGRVGLMMTKCTPFGGAKDEGAARAAVQKAEASWAPLQLCPSQAQVVNVDGESVFEPCEHGRVCADRVLRCEKQTVRSCSVYECDVAHRVGRTLG